MSMGSGNRVIFIPSDFNVMDHLDTLKESMAAFDEIEMSIDEVVKRFKKFTIDEPEITIEHNGDNGAYETQMYLIIEDFCHDMKFEGFWIGMCYSNERIMYNISADKKLLSKIKSDV
jgi:hypothetical protein